MMEILKQIDLFSPTINLQSVQVVLERIERAHTLLEECCVGFAIKCGDTNHGRFPITAHLHHVSVTSHKARLYVAVRINHFAKCCSQEFGIHLLEVPCGGDIVLCGISIHLPIQQNASLIFRQWVII